MVVVGGEGGGVGGVVREGGLESSYSGALDTHYSYRISDTHAHALSLTHSLIQTHTLPERSVSGR